MSFEAESVFIVVSGIPGSGKTTLGRKLATALQLPFFDKDDILDDLFEREGIGDAAWRRTLSRRSDEELRRLVMASSGAVVVSFWRTAMTGNESGTPVEWIRELSGMVIEVHCVCDPMIAAARFNDRCRHAGHLDQKAMVVDPTRFAHLASVGPLGVGEVMEVDTVGSYDLEAIANRIRSLANL